MQLLYRHALKVFCKYNGVIYCVKGDTMTAALHKTRSPTVTLKLDETYRQRLKNLAEAKHRSSHYLMKEAIERYLVQEEAEQAVLRSVDSEIANFEASGLHIDLTDVKDWAKNLKQNRSAQLPSWRA